MDALAIGVVLGAAAGLFHWGQPLWWILLLVAGHFFLFCNVFRITRRWELIWAGIFLLNVGIWTWLDRLNWLAVLLSQLPVTVVFILIETRSPHYHGIRARRWNPHLETFLHGPQL